MISSVKLPASGKIFLAPMSQQPDGATELFINIGLANQGSLKAAEWIPALAPAVSKEKYDDRSVLSATKGYTAQVTASGLTGFNQPTWDSSPLRPVPHTLKGLQPVTREPWAVDAQINRNMALEGFDTFSAKVENDSVAGNMAFWANGRDPHAGDEL